ncbi:phosphohydrolase [Paenibacillus mucilaginosus 3016]|uniref:Phosphohydrolase n=1 Tax=Paenibacillus mucilaginosus 3016 TaxID=1116391 RepID=H6NTE2_9BACL|nr:metallophosphoesterase [Paenibacillus mucilaginosus]AFC27604.1 phosphohydrolase [Paenibacillus mucilaginosus 3016]WFA16494.1 metallophosphoesterase [Paenibacillus mucilaginosus]
MRRFFKNTMLSISLLPALIASSAAAPLLHSPGILAQAGSGTGSLKPDSRSVQTLSASAGKPGVPAPPIPQAQPSFTFAVLSDVHVQAWNKASHRKLSQALNDIEAINPDTAALILNGDLTEGLTEDYVKLQDLLQDNPHPDTIFTSIGNHEFFKAWYDGNREWNGSTFPNGETEQASISRFLTFAGREQIYTSQVLSGYQFIFLGSERYRQSDPNNGEDAYLSDAQLNWLKSTLKSSEPGRPIFVFLHQPLPYTVSGTHFCCTNNRAVIQHEELKKILSGYPQVILFSGHTHWELKHPQTLVQDKFTMVNSSAVIETWREKPGGGDQINGPEESEGLYVEVYPDRVQIKGRDFYRHSWVPEAQFTVTPES